MVVSTKRFEYIDAMRGIAILFIVFGHIPLYCYGIGTEELSSFRKFTSMVQIPLFFFVSGFLFKIKPLSTYLEKIHYISKKVQQLIFPALVFGGIYIILNNISIHDCLMDKFKSGYWFTWSLFEFLIVQLIIELMAKMFIWKENELKYALICICTALIMYIISLPTLSNRTECLSGLLGLSLLRYYVYFVLGRLVHIHLYQLRTWKYRDLAVTMMVVTFICLSVTTWGMNCHFYGIFFHIHLALFELLSLLLLFAMFYRHKNYFTSNSKWIKILLLVGQRTLDIYLLHYFFLPSNLHIVGSYFVYHPAPIIEFAFASIITIMIVIICLLVSDFLHSSQLVTKLFLGGK